MRSDIHDTDSSVLAGIRVRLDDELHRRCFGAIGATTAQAIAAETGVTSRTVRRARQGIIGAVFMIKTWAALQRHTSALRDAGLEPPTLDDLFSIVDERETAA